MGDGIGMCGSITKGLGQVDGALRAVVLFWGYILVDGHLLGLVKGENHVNQDSSSSRPDAKSSFIVFEESVDSPIARTHETSATFGICMA